MSMIPRQLPLALEPAVGYSIDDFIMTETNRPVFDMLERWPRWPSPVLVLAGCGGSGKSHLAAVWAAQSFAMSFDHRRLGPAVDAVSRGIPVLLEDIVPGCFDETALFHLINAVSQAHVNFQQSSLLMTSRSRPVDWQVKLADLASRLKAVLLMEISPPDDRLLDAVVTKMFADRQLVINPHLIRYVSTRMERSLAKAAEFVALVDRVALERKSRITRRLVFDTLSRMDSPVSGSDDK